MTTQPYRVAAERHDPYAEAWAHLRRRRLVRRLIVGVVGYTFGTALVFGLKSASWATGGEMNYSVMAVGAVVAVGIGVVAAALARYLVPFVCPRCAEPFFRGLLMEIGFTKNCVNCGLAIGTPTPSVDADHDGER